MNFNIIFSPITGVLLLSFLESLVQNHTSQSGVVECLSAIKAKLSLYGKLVQAFSGLRITYYQKAHTMDRPFKVKLNAIIDLSLLSKIINLCDTLYMAQMFQAASLITFFSFLCISSLVPHKASSFPPPPPPPPRQLAREGIIFGLPDLHIIFKWSKTMQAKNAVKIIKLPELPFSLMPN